MMKIGMSMPGNNKTVASPPNKFNVYFFFSKDIRWILLDMTKGKEKHELERSLVWMQPKEERLERECCKLPTVTRCPYV